MPVLKVSSEQRWVLDRIKSDMTKQVDVSAGFPAVADNQFVNGMERDRVVLWLQRLNVTAIQYQPDTLCLAINLLDRLLSTVRVRKKYAECSSLACFLIAGRMYEATTPSVAELIKLSRLDCTLNDVARMENAILQKLQCPMTPTVFTFAQDLIWLLHNLTDESTSAELRRCHSSLQMKLFAVLGDHRLVASHPPALLALSVISLWLERLLEKDYWLEVTRDLCLAIGIAPTSVGECRASIAQIGTHAKTGRQTRLPTILEETEDALRTNSAKLEAKKVGANES